MDTLLERLGWFCEITGISICCCDVKEQAIEIHHADGNASYSIDFAEKCVLDFSYQK